MPAEAQLRVSPDVVAQDLGDGLVLLNLRTGIYWGLNRTGAVIWHGIQNRTGVEKICRQLREDFDGPGEDLAAAVRSLLSELAAERLIVEAPPSAEDAPGSAKGVGRRAAKSKKSPAANSARRRTRK
jgi:hypothetical protein